MSKSLALQAAMRAAFIASPAVLALVPASSILDRHRRPYPSPSVIIGEGIAGPYSGNVRRDRQELFAVVDVWAEEPSTEGVKRIMGALWAALKLDPRPALQGGYHLADWQVYRERVMRDPNGTTAHGILTVQALIGGGA